MRQATSLRSLKTRRQGLLEITDRITDWTPLEMLTPAKPIRGSRCRSCRA